MCEASCIEGGAGKGIGVQNMVVLVVIALGQETGKWHQAQGTAGREFQQLAAGRQSAQFRGQVQTSCGGIYSGAWFKQRKVVAGEGWALPLGHSSQIPPHFPSHPTEGAPGAVFVPAPLAFSTLASEGLNVNSGAEGTFQEMEFDSWFAFPLHYCAEYFLAYIHFRCQHGDSPTLRAEAPPYPIVPMKFGFGRRKLVPLSTRKSGSSHSGNGCQDLPRALRVGMLVDMATSGSHPHHPPPLPPLPI